MGITNSHISTSLLLLPSIAFIFATEYTETKIILRFVAFSNKKTVIKGSKRLLLTHVNYWSSILSSSSISGTTIKFIALHLHNRYFIKLH